ncbi:MAG TPA: hypothetical protein VN088_08450, partial [Nocardioides sp.]|nr:hypothetical protein [Nocardioides sp.]
RVRWSGLPRDGTALGWQTARITFRGSDSHPVVITKLVPVVLSSGAALAGWFEAPELGGGQALRFLVADLDDHESMFRVANESGFDGLLGAYAYRVTDDDVEHFELEVFTTSSRVSWGATWTTTG